MNNLQPIQQAIQTTIPTFEKPQSLPLESLQNVGRANLIEVGQVSTIEAAMNGANIRRLAAKSPEVLAAAISAQINHCARTYSGAREVSAAVLAECVDLLRSNYGEVQVEEITKAFQYAARNCAESLKAFYGVFSVALLANCLNPYMDHRRAIVESIWREQKRIETQESETRKADFWKTEEGRLKLEKMELERIEKIRTAKDPIFQDFTVNDYQVLCRHGFINLTPEEKRAYLDKAKPVYLSSLKTQRLSADSSTRDKIANFIYDLDNNIPNEENKNKIAIIAQKLIVCDFAKKCCNAEMATN